MACGGELEKHTGGSKVYKKSGRDAVGGVVGPEDAWS